MSNSDFLVRFWGVRGSIATPGAQWARYGGNTSCVEVRCGDTLLILDAGTGLREFGDHLQQQIEATILFTHCHVDHIEGLPFFRCLFDPHSSVVLRSGHLSELSLREVLAGYMAAPLFPVPPDIFEADVSYDDFRSGEDLHPAPELTVRTSPLNHPNGATGYRIEFNGRAVAYITDTEHVPGELDDNVLKLIRNADVVIYDSTFTDEDFEAYRGWGHSTWQQGVRLCEEANADRLVVFHHDPSRNDDAMDVLRSAAEARRPGTIVAREGMTLRLPAEGEVIVEMPSD